MKQLLVFSVLLSLCLLVGCGKGELGKKDVTPMPTKSEMEQMMKAQGQPPPGAEQPAPATPPKK